MSATITVTAAHAASARSLYPTFSTEEIESCSEMIADFESSQHRLPRTADELEAYADGQPNLDAYLAKNPLTPPAAPAASSNGMAEKLRIAGLVAKYRQVADWQMAVLRDVQGKSLSTEDAGQIMSALAPKQEYIAGKPSLKVTEKGQVHIRGIRGINVKFGLPLYVEAVEDILNAAEQIKEFIKANNGKLARKSR